MARDNRVIAVSGHLADPPATVSASSVSAASRFCIRPTTAEDVILAEIDGGKITRNDRVWFDLGASLEPAYYLEVEDDTSMYGYVISAADGRLLFRRSLTEDAGTPFNYRVWADNAGTHSRSGGVHVRPLLVGGLTQCGNAFLR